jgi:hypothetical protein
MQAEFMDRITFSPYKHEATANDLHRLLVLYRITYNYKESCVSCVIG